MGDRLTATTTSAGNAGGTTLVSTALPDEDFGGDDEAFNSFWVLITSGTNNGEIRRVARTSGYTASTGTLTVTRAFTAQVATSVTFELHRYDPRIKHMAINRALNHVWPHIFREVIDESLVVDNLLLNADFETASGGAPTEWTGSSLTITQSTTRVIHGTNSANLVTTAANATYRQTLTVNINELTGKSVRFGVWVYSTVASHVRARIRYDGTNYFNSAYHSGNDQWELLTAEGTFPSTTTEVVAEIQFVVNTTTAQVDAAWLEIDPVTAYTIPAALIKGPYYVHQQAYEDHPEGPYWPFFMPIPGRRLRLIGAGSLTQLSADTDTAEVGNTQAEVVAYLATGLTFQTLAAHAALEENERFLTLARFYLNAAETLLANPAIGSNALGAEYAHGWYVNDSAGTRTLILTGGRSF